MADTPVFVPGEEKEFQTFYKRSLFWLKAKPVLKKVGIGALIVFDVLMLGIGTYRFLDYGVFDFFEERAMVGAIVDGIDDMHTVSVARAATGLKSSDAKVFALGDGRVDFYVELTNPNVDWYARFQYRFIYENDTTALRDGFILPGEQAKPLTELAFDASPVSPKTARLVISDIEWIRVNHHAIGVYADWQSERLNFAFNEVTFDNAVAVDSTTIGRTTFKVANASAFGYWNASFTIVLLRNDNVVGVTTANVQDFSAGEERSVVVNWFGNVPEANATLIVPNIDIFDPSVFMPLRGEPVPDVRERIQIDR